MFRGEAAKSAGVSNPKDTRLILVKQWGKIVCNQSLARFKSLRFSVETPVAKVSRKNKRRSSDTPWMYSTTKASSTTQGPMKCARNHKHDHAAITGFRSEW